jgi:hypothetical protein
MVPVDTAQLVAPAEVNCWVPPSMRLALAGEIDMACGAVSVTTALAEPPGPVAVTVALLPEAGAVKRPVALIVPALAVQLVAPGEVNCSVLP